MAVAFPATDTVLGRLLADLNPSSDAAYPERVCEAEGRSLARPLPVTYHHACLAGLSELFLDQAGEDGLCHVFVCVQGDVSSSKGDSGNGK